MIEYTDNSKTGIEVDIGNGGIAAFDWAGRTLEQAIDNAQFCYGEPHAGIMVVKYNGKYWCSDGIDSHTGSAYVPEEIEKLKAAGFEEFHILEG